MLFLPSLLAHLGLVILSCFHFCFSCTGGSLSWGRRFCWFPPIRTGNLISFLTGFSNSFGIVDFLRRRFAFGLSFPWILLDMMQLEPASKGFWATAISFTLQFTLYDSLHIYAQIWGIVERTMIFITLGNSPISLLKGTLRKNNPAHIVIGRNISPNATRADQEEKSVTWVFAEGTNLRNVHPDTSRSSGTKNIFSTQTKKFLGGQLSSAFHKHSETPPRNINLWWTPSYPSITH